MHTHAQRHKISKQQPHFFRIFDAVAESQYGKIFFRPKPGGTLTLGSSWLNENKRKL